MYYTCTVLVYKYSEFLLALDQYKNENNKFQATCTCKRLLCVHAVLIKLLGFTLTRFAYAQYPHQREAAAWVEDDVMH